MNEDEANRPAYRLTTLFFRNRHLLVFSVAGIMAAGLASLNAMPRLEDPRLMNRNPVITTLAPGASAERVEALVTDTIETALAEIDSIKTVESTSRAGISVVAVELKDRVTDNQPEFARIRSALADVAGRLPPEAQRPVFDDQRGAVAFTLVLGLVWPRDTPPPAGVMGRLAEDLADRLRTVPGTELVRVYGAPEEEILVTPDLERMDDLGFDAAALARRIASADSRSPAGVRYGAEADWRIDIEGVLDAVQRIEQVPVFAGDDGSLVRVGDLAMVARSQREPASVLAFANGHRAVLVAVRADPGVRVDAWRGPAQDVLDLYAAELGGSLRLETVFDQTRYTTARLGELGGNLLAGALVIVAVVLVLMGWRAALAVGSTLPLASAATVFGVAVAGGALHQISIFGMIIALGLLIDNAIVVVDEVHARLRGGASRPDAVAGTVRHLFVPLSASTLTTVVAFMPILLLPGNVGEFVGSIGTSVIIALLSSYAIALTITPALAALWAGHPDAGDRWWQRGVASARLAARWQSWLRQGLARPARLAMLSCLLPLLGFAGSSHLGSQFFPLVDRDMFGVRLWMPPGTSIERTTEVVMAVEAGIRREEGIVGVHWMVGGSFPSVYYNVVMDQERAPAFAQGVITAASSDAVRSLAPALQRMIDEQFPDVQAVVKSFAQGPPVNAEVEFRLYGPSIEALQKAGEQVRGIMAAHPGILHTRISMARGEPHLRFVPEEDDVRLAGFGLDELAVRVHAFLEGVAGGSVQEDLTALPVRVRGEAARRDAVAELGDLVVRGQGSSTPLSALGTFMLEPDDGAITRRNGLRVNAVLGHARKGVLPINISRDLEQQLSAIMPDLPPGITIQTGGDAEQEQQAVGQLGLYLPLLLVVMVGTVVLSFRSVRLAVLLGSVAALSVGLGLLATWISGFPVSFNTLLGTAGLIGLALNDSIVVLAALEASPGARRGLIEPIVTEVSGCLRHVIGTTLTTVGGFLPLLVVIGGDFWPPLAVVLSGGVIGSTLLAIFYVPAVYRIMALRRVA